MSAVLTSAAATLRDLDVTLTAHANHRQAAAAVAWLDARFEQQWTALCHFREVGPMGITCEELDTLTELNGTVHARPMLEDLPTHEPDYGDLWERAMDAYHWTPPERPRPGTADVWHRLFTASAARSSDFTAVS